MKTGTKVFTTFDEYTLIKQLGQGGAGTVYEAKTSDGVSRALKILRSGISLEKAKRFKNEIAFCQKNAHAGIISILDHGLYEEKGERRLFYVMPLYEKTYRKYLEVEKRPDILLSSIIKILDGLEAAHLLKCFHRDIKPENILVNAENSEFVISDFGIAHFEEEDLVTPVETLHADRLANFQYAAPEQRQKGGKVDLRADIYALGLLINETFTGIVPHGTGFKKIKEVVESCSYLDDIVEKMISQSPESRYQTIKELKNDLYKKAKLEVSFQKLNIIEKTVVPEADISSNPLVATPVKIISFDYVNGNFVCKLNHSLPEDWTSAFYARGANSWSGMHHPQMVKFSRESMSIETPIEYIPQAKKFFDDWLDGTNMVYRDLLDKNERRKVEERRRALEVEAEQERKKQEYLSKISL